ncbi:ABC transporter ATP-binding protein [Mycoplasmatota bacterium]|nr:ABC transporter ATP-binding protein [Mycoplasmatota bacterium]
MLKVYKNLKPFIFYIILVVIFTGIQALLQLRLPKIMGNMVNQGVMTQDVDFVMSEGLEMLVVTGISAVFTVLGSFFAAKASIGLGKILRNKIFKKIESFSLNEFDKFGTATLVTRSTNDIMQIQQVTFMILRMVVLALVTSIGGIYYAVTTDLKLSAIFLVVVPVMACAILIIGTKAVPLFKVMQKKLDKINLVSREGLTGVRVIRAFNRTNYEANRFEEANIDYTDTAIRVNKLLALLMPIIMLVMNLMSVGILWFGTKRFDVSIQEMIINGTEIGFNFGNIMEFIQYAFQVMFSLLMVTMMFIMIPRAQASAQRINEVLETEPSINDLNNITQDEDMNTKKGYVEYKNVEFSFHGAEEPAIKNISFNSKPGEVTAIIGGTGSGKSTIINLIPRFYDAQSGEILVDGVNVKDLSQAELREKIGYVPQTAVLFSGTIAENIRYGKKDATVEEIEQALKIAQATEFVSEMKDGLDSMIAQGGTNISGGQKQRLSIARALVRKPEIYIFDDSFSALDFKTDAKLRAALKQETKNSTVIIVAQRVSTIMDADKILVLDEGRIVGEGTHKELMKNCETYKEIVSSQLSEEELS